MNKKLVMILALAFAFAGTRAFAEETKPATEAPAAVAAQPSAEEVKMAEMKKLGMPNENHKVLEGTIGKWNAKVTMWMSPEAKPEVSEGTSDHHWIMGGRFVQQDFKGSFMGQPFEGMGIIGYDNIRAEYTSLWLDNMSTSIMIGNGQYDAATMTMNENATVACPMTGEKNRKMRTVCKIVDADHLTHEMYMNDKDGKEFKGMEIAYERVK